MIAVVLPPTVVVAVAILVPLLGWGMAAVHTLSMCGVVILLIELAALSIRFVPFTNAYPPGHAKLKSLWWVYVFGLIVFAYWPARITLSLIQAPIPLFEMMAGLAVVIGMLEIVGRRRTVRESLPEDEDQEDDQYGVTVLDIGTVAQRIHVD